MNTLELLRASGLHPIVIDEDTDFDEVTRELEANRRHAGIVDLAHNEYHIDGACEIDHDAKLSEGEGNGCWVQAWVWVNFAGTPYDKEARDAASDQR